MKKNINKKIIVLSMCLLLSSNYALSREVSQQDVQRYSTYYSNGLEYIKNEQYSSAIIEFKKVLRFSPYDSMTQNAIIQAYCARAQYFKQTTKEYKKALNDYKSAVFYAKYWNNQVQNQTLLTVANSAQKEINDLEKRLNLSQSEESKLKEARILKAQGELAASGYNFQELKNSKYKEDAYKNLGNIYKNLNNQSKAIDSYKTALDINPKNAEIHFLYGVLLDEVGNYDASLEQYNYALQYGDKSPELLEILENKWTQNIVNNPNDAQSYANLGAIYQKQGNLENARVQYLKAYNLDSDDETILYNLASLYNQQKNYNGAISIYDKLLAKNPKNIEVLNYKAQALENLNRYEEAINQYETILAINPNDKNAKDNLDNIIMNRFSGAKLQNYLITKAKNNPASYEAQFNCALELHKNKNYDSAIQYYQKAMNINPSKEETYLNLAQIYLEKKDYQNADTICQKGLIYLPNSTKINDYLADIKDYRANSQYETASALYNQKQYQKAIAEYNKIQDKTKEVKLAIASCYWELKDYKNANKYYLELLQEEPNNEELLSSSAWAYYSLDDYQNAKIMAQKALNINSYDSDMKNLISDIDNLLASNELNEAIQKYEQGNYNEALNAFNKILSKNPDDEYSIYYKGLCYDELKKPNDAIKQYKSLIFKNPNFTNAYYSLAVDLDNNEKYKEAVSNYQKFLELKKQQNESDEMTTFAQSRIKELNNYLASLDK